MIRSFRVNGTDMEAHAAGFEFSGRVLQKDGVLGPWGIARIHGINAVASDKPDFTLQAGCYFGFPGFEDVNAHVYFTVTPVGVLASAAGITLNPEDDPSRLLVSAFQVFGVEQGVSYESSGTVTYHNYNGTGPLVSVLDFTVGRVQFGKVATKL